MEENQNNATVFSRLSQAMAYLTGGIFLWVYSSSVSEEGILIGKIFGAVFILLAFLLLISSILGQFRCLARLKSWANGLDKIFLFTLFIVALASLIIGVLEAEELRTLWIVIAVVFVLLILASLFIYVIMVGRDLRNQLGTRRSSARMLIILAFVLSTFALANIILKADFLGGPLILLAISVVCLSIASIARIEE